jgi:hypothetical protein
MIFEKKNHAAADFSVPSDGLFLLYVEFKDKL